MFTLKKTTKAGRMGLLKTPHGAIPTPVFMPVATAGAMKGITFDELKMLGADMMLCNTYHLHLTPGEKIIQKGGGLHGFTGWKMPILTDSGGFQVFSLEAIRTITDKGVDFRDHRSGKPHFIGPKEAMRIQHALGADIIMCFDECPPSTAPREQQEKAVERTILWAKICKKEHQKLKKGKKSPLLFGIVQGGLEKDLRIACAQELIKIGFDGYAVGGLAVGESEEEMFRVLSWVLPILPEKSPRYLMGVGERHQMKKAIALGIDMFDCVSPMREARHGNIWLSNGKKLKIRRAENKEDFSPIDKASPVKTSALHSKAYLHYLLRVGERYGETLACLQNLGVTLKGIRDIRSAIKKAKAL